MEGFTINNTITKRNPSLDIARIIATLAVVMIHCSAYFVGSFDLFTDEFILGNIFDSVSRIGVPLFLMISGSLFLDEQRNITLKNIFSNNIRKIVIITIFWSAIYTLIYNLAVPLLTNKPVIIKNIVLEFLNGHYHMWYLYMIIGLYVITPFLKKFVYKDNKEMVLFFIIVSFLVQYLTPIIDIICKLGLNISFINSWLDKFELNFFGGYITYFLIGWYIVHIGINKNWIKYLLYFSGTLSLIFIISYVHFTGDHKNIYIDISAPVLVYSVSVFFALNNKKIILKEKSIKTLAFLSNLTFGVYIVHVVVLSVFTKIFEYSSNPLLYIIGSFLTVVLFSFLFTYIVSKIPIMKKLIKF